MLRAYAPERAYGDLIMASEGDSDDTEETDACLIAWLFLVANNTSPHSPMRYSGVPPSERAVKGGDCSLEDLVVMRPRELSMSGLGTLFGVR